MLAELRIDVPGACRVGDMVVEGPTGRRVLLPALPGRDYADHGLAVSRSLFDDLLVEAAVSAGARLLQGRVVDVTAGSAAEPRASVRLADGRVLNGTAVIGADGATSSVARSAELVDDDRVLWAFAVRCYLEQPVDLPHIVLWEPRRGELFPGYGWLFPAPDGGANAGLGLGLPGPRTASRRAGRELDAFLAHLAGRGLIGSAAHGRVLGGWLKLGVVGTVPALDRVLLAGDAAGLVNPLQGEGIATALASGRAAAEAVLADPDRPGPRYRRALTTLSRHHRSSAPLYAAMMRHPGAVSAASRFLTLPGVGHAVGGGWGLYWNDLACSADPGPHRTVGAALASLTRVAAARGSIHSWFATHLDVDRGSVRR